MPEHDTVAILTRRIVYLAPVLAAMFLIHPAFAAEPPKDVQTKAMAEDKEALARFQDLVGQWKGMGQERSGKQAKWGEEGEWCWQFKEGRAHLSFKPTQFKIFSSARLERGDKQHEFKFTGKLDEKEAIFTGKVDEEGELILESAEPAKDQPARVTISFAAKGKRLVLFIEKQDPASKRFQPLAEIGYTRMGSGFGQDQIQNECVITGGVGTISVSHKGTKYWVCCSGCKDVFNDNPEGELAAYRDRKAKEQAKAKVEVEAKK